MVRRVMAILILAALLMMVQPTIPAFAADHGTQTDDLLIYGVSCSADGAFSAAGFASKVNKNRGSVVVTIDLVGICPDGQVLTLTYTHSADLSALPNLNARAAAKSNGKSDGYSWSVDDGIAAVPEFGPIDWSATHIRVTLTNRSKSVVKETDLPLPYSPF